MPILQRLNQKIGAFAIVGSICGAMLIQSIPASASATSELNRIFGRIDQQLCHTFNVDRCEKKKRSKTVKTLPAQAGKPSSAPTTPGAPAQPEATEKSTAAPAKAKPHEVPVPVPQPRPQYFDQKKDGPSVPIPVPPPEMRKPAPVVPKPAPAPIVPEPSVVVPPVTVSLPHPMPDDLLVGEACYVALQKIGARFERLTTPVGSGTCSVSDPVKLTALASEGGDVKFPEAPTFSCGFAFRFSSWVKEQAEPIVQSGLNAKIATMGTGPGYQCRGRNGDNTAKLSEHAFGNAVDIERMKLANGEVIEVSNAIDTSSKYQPVLSEQRSTGCKYFMTVLGPGANSAHAMHFHFDLERRGKKGDSRLCE